MLETYSPRFIADKIFDQMGGKGRLSAMTGAKDYSFSCDPATRNVTARFVHMLSESAKNPRGKVNLCEVIYSPSLDTYTIKFARYKKPTAKNGFRADKKIVSQIKDVQCSQLFEIFERHTGLDLSFPMIVSKN